MTSVLNVDEIAAKDGTSPVALTKQSAPKAWANLNGTTFGLRDSFNMSSATDHGTGDYTFTLSSSMSDANYGVTAIGAGGYGTSASMLMIATTGSTTEAAPTSSTIRVTTSGWNGARYDSKYTNSSFNGDLA